VIDVPRKHSAVWTNTERVRNALKGLRFRPKHPGKRVVSLLQGYQVEGLVPLLVEAFREAGRGGNCCDDCAIDQGCDLLRDITEHPPQCPDCNASLDMGEPHGEDCCAKPDTINPCDVAILGGDPSL